jgi:polyferredoxin
MIEVTSSADMLNRTPIEHGPGHSPCCDTHLSAADPRQVDEVPRAARVDRWIAAAGEWLARNQRAVMAVQWIIVGIYALLVVVPAFLPPPARTAHIWTNLTLFAQFVFWGIWWPFVLVSMVMVGRLWCGVMCPEGALSETASRHGRGRSAPAWVKWKMWPFVAFVLTTVYGQMLSVYQYPKPALLILGGSTVAAIWIGYMYGRNKRIWCKYLCPVHGVFGLLSKLSPLHYRVDRAAWDDSPKPVARLNCAPMVPIRTMQGASTCHMCGRCAGFRDAVALSRRTPGSEIVHVAGSQTKPWETWLIVFGLLGVAAGAFHWASSPYYIAGKQAAAEWLVDKDVMWPITGHVPWWVLTNYPDLNDVMSPLDGAMLLTYLTLVALVFGGAIMVFLASAGRLLARPLGGATLGAVWRQRTHHLAQALIPIAGSIVFLGLLATTTSILKADGIRLTFMPTVENTVMAAAALWSVALAWRICGLYAGSRTRQIAATTLMLGAIGAGALAWALPY